MRTSLIVVFALAVGFTMACPTNKVQAQTFVGKWVHQGPKGSSFMEFFPGEKRVLGATRGEFHHMVLLDNGQLIQGDGHYVYRPLGLNRGRLTLHFADGHVTHEHEYTSTDNTIVLRHHGITQAFIRQVDSEPARR